MARPREFDIEDAIAAIAETFWAHGYEATSIADLEEATGLARARLYAAFGSKQDMLHRAISHYLATTMEPIFQRVDDGGVDAIATWFRNFAMLRRERPNRALMGCLMVNSIVELGTTDPGVVELGERYRTRVGSAFRSALETSASRGELDGDVESKVELATVLLFGLFVAIKSGAAVEEVERLSRVAAEAVDAWRVAA